jgi:hypothetical protein
MGGLAEEVEGVRSTATKHDLLYMNALKAGPPPS